MSFSSVLNSLEAFITPVTQNSDAEIWRFLKKIWYPKYKEREYRMFNCPEKAKISRIINAVSIADIENVD